MRLTKKVTWALIKEAKRVSAELLNDGLEEMGGESEDNNDNNDDGEA